MRSYTFEKLPAELRASHSWLVWKYGPEARRQKNGKLPKDPVDPVTGIPIDRKLAAKLSFEEAVKAAPKFSGLGLLSRGRLLALDFDECISDGTIIDKDKAEAIQKLNSYTELSPSETGVRVWVFGDALRDPVKSEINPFAGSTAANKWARKTKFIEIYPDSPSSNYVTATGWHLPGCPIEVRELSAEEVRELYSWADKPEVKAKALKADSRYTRLQRFHLLTSGSWQPLHSSQSEADLELCAFLAEANGGLAEAVERDFRASKLYRPPSVKSGDYVGRTVRLAIERWKEEQAKPKRYRDKVEYTRELIVTRGSEIVERAQEYFWEPYLPIGQLVHFGGAQAQGKSPVAIDLAARLTTGKVWPDDVPGCGIRSVLLLGIEDDPAAVTVPRFKLAGGNPELLYLVKGTKLTAENTILERGVALDADLEQLVATAKATKDLGMIIIDPITNYLGKVKMNADEEVRTILTPLAMLAAELNVIVVNIGHFNRRDKGTDPLNRLMGAAAFTGVARSVTLFGPDPDIESTHHHIMTLARGATESGGMKYHTDIELREFEGKKSKVVKVHWDGKAEVHADDATDSMSRQDKSKKAEGAELIRGLLSSGKRQAVECLAFLKQNGIDPEKINSTHILRAAGGRAVREGKAWWWLLGTTSADLDIR